jgi:Putative prokaryotic signal transducing protein
MADEDDVEQLTTKMEGLSTEELVSILRNHDEDEWRPPVFDVVATILASRGVSPGEVEGLGPEGGDVPESAPLVTVATFFSPPEAHASRMALEEGGIAAWVADEAVGTMYGVGVGTRLQVRASDEATAREILASPAAPTDVLPPEISDPACPACGSRNVAPQAWPEDAQQSPALWPGGRVWHYVCSDCDEAWPLEEAPKGSTE